MLRSPIPQEAWVEVSIDGEHLRIPPGKNLAASLLAAGHTDFGVDVHGTACRPLCMIGQCFGCWLREDGKSVQACLRAVRAGAQLHTDRRR
jgi:aerobic-type carbon monoxide dehydrogenase small subunit (CoxS/CutS family)